MTSTLAVLFTDLVGSTEQRVRLGSAAADDLRRRHFAATREIVERHAGREIKNLGDGVLAVFGGASTAVAASVALQRAVERHNRSARPEHRLELRVGVSIGEVVEEADDVFGEPVIEAARLCAAADGAQVLLGPAIVHLVDRGDRAHLRAAGDRVLKGFTEPIAVHEVDWRGYPAEAVVPLQRRIDHVDDAFPFTGRLEEWTGVLGAFEATRRGERRLVALSGEPGIGKTRLAHQLARHAHAEGALVVGGRCDPEFGHPYHPVAEALRHLVAHLSDEVLADHTDRRGSELARLVPELLERCPGLAPPSAADPATERYELFRAVHDLLGAAASGVPTVLVVDDAHWADRATVHLVRDLLTRDDGHATCVVTTSRQGEVDRAHPFSTLVGELEGSGIVERIALGGLDPDEVLTLVEGGAGHTIDPEAATVLRRIAADTGGNPLFLTQILRHLAEREVIRVRAGRWELAAPLTAVMLPDSVRAVVARRVQELDESAARLLRVAALAGQWFDLETVATVAGVDEDDALDVVEQAMARNLVQEDGDRPGRFGFVHALVRQALEEELSATRRSRLHLRFADVLDQSPSRDERAPDIATHLVAAGAPVEVARLLGALVRAARRSLDDLGYEEAVAFADQGIDRAGSAWSALRADLLLVRGEAYRRMGDERSVEDLLAVAAWAKAEGDPVRLGRAAISLLRAGAWYAEALRVRDDLVAPAEDALEALDGLGADHDRLRGQVMVGLATQLAFAPSDRDRALSLCDAALGIAERSGDERAVAEALFARWLLHWHPAGLDERLAIHRRLADIAEGLGSTELRFTVDLIAVYQALEQGDRAHVERVLSRLRDEASSLRVPYYVWLVRQVDTLLAIASVEPSADERLQGELDLGLATGQGDAMIAYAAALFALRQAQGRLAELADLVPGFVAEYPIPAWRLAAVAAALAAGRSEPARAGYEEVAAAGFATVADFTEPAALVLAADLCVELGDRDRAADLVPRLEPYRDRVAIVGSGTCSLGSYARPLGTLLGLLGQLDDAVAALERGIEIDERMEARFHVLRGLESLEETLRTRDGPGDADRARGLADRARALEAELARGTSGAVVGAPGGT